MTGCYKALPFLLMAAACGDGAALAPADAHADTVACGGIVCPGLLGHTAACNARGHCEYASVDQTGWRVWDTWIWIPPGTFPMGSQDTEVDHGDNEGPVHDVVLSVGYFIGKFEVPTAVYAACRSEHPEACTEPSSEDWEGMGWGTNTMPDRAAHPQNGISWEQAGAVCDWLGARRPTEAEWEYAATGPVHTTYVWGDGPEPSCSAGVAVFDEPSDGARPMSCDACTDYGCSGTKPVGTMPAGASWCGALDMAGNVWEWCEDVYHDTYDGAPSDGGAWVTEPVVYRAARGGSFYRGAASLRVASRDRIPPGTHFAAIGVRCVIRGVP